MSRPGRGSGQRLRCVATIAQASAFPPRQDWAEDRSPISWGKPPVLPVSSSSLDKIKPGLITGPFIVSLCFCLLANWLVERWRLRPYVAVRVPGYCCYDTGLALELGAVQVGV